MIRGYRVYDTHVHIGEALHSGRRYSADQLLADMDRNGVDRALVIPYPVVADYRAAHDEIGAAVRAHPDRLTGTACLPAFLPRQVFDDEVRRCVEEHGFRALKLQPQYQPLNPLSPRSDSFWEAAVRHRLPVVVHTGNGVPFALPALYQMPAQRFPEVRIVLAHCGGPMLYLEAIVAARMCPNIWLELSSLMPHHAQEVLAHVPPERIMVGSDLPASQATELEKVFSLDLDEAGREWVLWRTGRAVFDGE